MTPSTILPSGKLNQVVVSSGNIWGTLFMSSNDIHLNSVNFGVFADDMKNKELCLCAIK